MNPLMIFVLGALSALGLFCLGFSFVSVLKMKKTIKNQESEIDKIYNSIKENEKNISEHVNQVERFLSEEIKEVYKYTDSRFDKSSDKVSNVISSTTEILSDELVKLKEVFTKQIDEFAKVTLEHSVRLSELETYKKIEEDKLEQLNS